MKAKSGLGSVGDKAYVAFLSLCRKDASAVRLGRVRACVLTFMISSTQ